MKADEARKQRDQLERYLKWVKEEGGVEGPTHLDTWFKPHQKYRLRWLKRHCVGTVMELGTCYGYVLAYCGGQIGVDWNQQSIALARILNPGKEFVEADIRNLPFPDSYVDTVMACDVLEHLPWDDVHQALREARRVAKQRVLITIPDERNIPDSTCFKHLWVASPEKVEVMAAEFPEAEVDIIKKVGFILMEVRK